MELVFKLPKGKIPFIGVIFQNLYESATLNQDLVNSFKNSNYKIVMEQIKSEINLRLICEEHLLVRFYNGLKYDKMKLDAWLYLTQKSQQFNFSHLVKEGDKEIVVKTLKNQKLFVLKVENCHIIT